jgi:hypothetical protein
MRRYFFFAFFSSTPGSEVVEPLALLLPLASVDCVAVPVADWLPVLVVAAWLEDWLPVVLVALELADWSPVVAVLSIDSVDRPRRSMFGLKVEVVPVTAVFCSDEDPVMLEPCEVVEPVTDGLALAVPDAFTPVEAVLPVEADVPDAVEGAVAAEVPGSVEPTPLAAESGVQSMCTGLDECSLAMPVSLPASLPAFGWFRLLHSGLGCGAVAACVELGIADEPDEVPVVDPVCAKAAPVAAITAAASALRVKWMRFIGPP